jgi:hypothetical protein
MLRPMSDHHLPHGSFELHDRPADAFRGLYAMMGPVAIYLAIMWLCAVHAAIYNRVEGAPSAIADIFALAGVVIFGALGWAAYRPRPADVRRYTVEVNDRHIAVQRQSGLVTLNWKAVTSARRRGGMLCLRGGNIVMILPAYRLSAVQLAAIQSQIDSHPVEASVARRQTAAKWVPFVGVLLILCLVALYNLLFVTVP